jgi:hypothetical protein
MRIPNFNSIRRQTDFHIESYAQHMHPDPRFYKYTWWIFWRNSKCDGREFLSLEHSLSTGEALDLMTKLSMQNESHWVYNKATPRHDPGVTPFDIASPKWLSTIFAPPISMDNDRLWNGHK